MNINEKELNTLSAMLENYKQEHGTISESMNMTCPCEGACKTNCTYSCDRYNK